MERNRSHFWRATLPANKDSKLTVTLSVTLRRHFEMREKLSTFASAKRGRAQAFPLFAFLAPIPLYDRKNYLI